MKNFKRRSLHELTRYFAGEDGAQGGGDAGGGTGQAQAGAGGAATGLPPVFNAREHLGDDGSFKADWWKSAGVSETVGKKFTRPEALARSYEQLETQIGKKGVIVPGANASQAERDAYYTALGRPAKPEEYGFVKPDKVKIGDKEMAVPDHAWDADRAKAWQQKLYDMGVSKETAHKIMQASLEESVLGLDMIQQGSVQATAKARADLVTAFGGEEGFKTQLSAARRAAEQFGGDELVNHPGLGSDPVMIKTLAKVAAAMGEQPGAGLRQQAGQNRMTPAEAKEAGQKLTAEIATKTKENQNWGNTAEAAKLKSEKTRLFQIAYPN